MSVMFVARDFEAGLYPAPVVDGMAVAWLEFTVVAEVTSPVDRFPVTVFLTGSRVRVDGAVDVGGVPWRGRVGLMAGMCGRGAATERRAKIDLDRQGALSLVGEAGVTVWELRACGDLRQIESQLVTDVSLVDCGFVVELPGLDVSR